MERTAYVQVLSDSDASGYGERAFGGLVGLAGRMLEPWLRLMLPATVRGYQSRWRRRRR